MSILPTTLGFAGFLHVNEIELFGPDNSAIKATGADMSSQYEGFAAVNCIDGNKETFCHTAFEVNPRMRVFYPCPGGTVLGTKVVLTNRPGLESRLSNFQLDFANPNGSLAEFSYSLAPALSVYTLTAWRKHLCSYLPFGGPSELRLTH